MPKARATKALKTTGSFLDIRLAILRTDFDPQKHGEQISFFAGDEPLFQDQNGAIDQDNQVAISVFGFDEPHDGMAISIRDGQGKQEALLYGEDTDSMEDDIATLISKHLVADKKVASAVANVVAVAWGFGGDYSEVEEESLENLEKFQWTGEEDSDELTLEDDSFGGGVLCSSVMCSDVPAVIQADGATELDLGDGEISDFSGDRFICIVKPEFKAKISEAVSG